MVAGKNRSINQAQKEQQKNINSKDRDDEIQLVFFSTSNKHSGQKPTSLIA